MRKAASAWEEDFARRLEGIGFKRGRAASTVFYREATGCRCVVHGDDFTFLATEKEGRKVVEDMKGWYDLKVRAVLGDAAKDDKEVVILGRELRWTPGGIEYEADARHEEEIRKEMKVGLDSKGLEAPAMKEELPEGFEEEKDDPVLEGAASWYRGVSARGNYLGLDRMDLAFAAKEACRQMAQPRVSGEAKLKRMARYLLTYPKVVWKFRKGKEGVGDLVLDVYSDSDWAGCRRTRRSTSGGVAAIDGGAIKHWASTQGSIALSVGEAEYYALIKAAAEGLGMVALAADLGWEMGLRLHVDSNTAKAIVARLGVGRVRHMEVRYLWAQEAYRCKRFEVRKIAGEANPADILTKPMSAQEMEEKMGAVGGNFLYPRKP